MRYMAIVLADDCVIAVLMTVCIGGRRHLKRRRGISRIAGRGAYYMNGKRVFSGTGVPQFGKSHGSCYITHREYITDITAKAAVSGSGPFNITSYVIQPGVDSASATPYNSPFPWLSAIASEFEEYEIRGMLFEFISTSGTYVGGGTTSSLPQVIMATQYNAANAPFINKQSMEQYQGAVSSMASRNCCHGVEVARSTSPMAQLYTRSGPVPSGQDPRLYDFGLFSIATQGGPQTTDAVVGELWVTYKVKLIKPKQGTSSGVNQINSDHFQLP